MLIEFYVYISMLFGALFSELEIGSEIRSGKLFCIIISSP